MIEDAVEPWVTGQLCLALLAVDPAGLKGLHLRARASPTRDAFLAALPEALRPLRRIAPTISDTQLFGGIDIPATLSTGHVVRSDGLLATPQTLLLSMAERCPGELAARLAQALDGGSGHSLILLDEGAEPDETAPASLTERLAFSVDLAGLRAMDLAEIALGAQDIDAARGRLARLTLPESALPALAGSAMQLGIASLRAPILALRAARAHAALCGHDSVGEDDLTMAAQLVFASRATRLPEDPAESDESDPPPGQTQTEPEDGEGPDEEVPPEMLVEAIRAILPPDLMTALQGGRPARGARGSGGAGAKRRGNRRGRPLPSRKGHPDGHHRIDIIATLRAAAPWQPLRRKAEPQRSGVLIRPSDIHIRQFQEMSDRLVIFAVDASGSSAVARLSEAKGAVELMLAEAYARRDHVALLAFRGEGAQILLPPTRSLVQTKRRLAGLHGGGGTPLAAGLRAAADLARQAEGHGLTPSIALLTDGRANVPLPGRTGRAAAREDAEAMARVLRAGGWPMAVVDTAQRPQPDLRRLADLAAAHYIALPRADAARLNRAIGQALEA